MCLSALLVLPLGLTTPAPTPLPSVKRPTVLGPTARRLFLMLQHQISQRDVNQGVNLAAFEKSLTQNRDSKASELANQIQSEDLKNWMKQCLLGQVWPGAMCLLDVRCASLWCLVPVPDTCALCPGRFLDDYGFLFFLFQKGRPPASISYPPTAVGCPSSAVQLCA